jgi:hypothetical protein
LLCHALLSGSCATSSFLVYRQYFVSPLIRGLKVF